MLKGIGECGSGKREGCIPKVWEERILIRNYLKYFDSECSTEVLRLFAKLTRYNHYHMLELHHA